MRIKAKLPERQSEGVIGPPMTEDDYLRHTSETEWLIGSHF